MGRLIYVLFLHQQEYTDYRFSFLEVCCCGNTLCLARKEVFFSCIIPEHGLPVLMGAYCMGPMTVRRWPNRCVCVHDLSTTIILRGAWSLGRTNTAKARVFDAFRYHHTQRARDRVRWNPRNSDYVWRVIHVLSREEYCDRYLIHNIQIRVKLSVSMICAFVIFDFVIIIHFVTYTTFDSNVFFYIKQFYNAALYLVYIISVNSSIDQMILW